MNFKEWIIDLFRDERGGTSIKPVVGLMGALVLCIALLFNLNPGDRLVEAVVLITIGGLGGDTWDKFSTKLATPAPSVPEDTANPKTLSENDTPKV